MLLYWGLHKGTFGQPLLSGTRRDNRRRVPYPLASMCARRFLSVIFFLTLLVVGGSCAVYQWGGNVLLKQATPRGGFTAPPAGAPDYRVSENWIALPTILDSPAKWLPDGVAPEEPAGLVFYVHPTTYLQRDRWNAPLQPGGETELRTRLFVQSQASAFNGAGEIWAPRYRQAAFGAFLLKSDDATKALDLAYGDVRAAFTEFLRLSDGKPLILAGHSQGALHLSRLLRDDAARLKGRLVAAYVVGWPLSTTADLPTIGLPACASPDQTGCILSWQSFGEPANPDLILDAWEGTEGPTGVKRERKDMLCVNPLTGTRNGSAPPSGNPGTLIPSANLQSVTLSPGLVGARCDNGFLLLGGAVPAMGPYVLPGNNFHVYDYALFWSAIRTDAKRRLAAWQAR